MTLIASTTENPYFYVYNALLSRCTVFEFKSLTAEDIAEGVKHAAQRLGESDGTPVNIPVDALEYLAQSAGGDMRKALGNLEFAVSTQPPCRMARGWLRWKWSRRCGVPPCDTIKRR